MEDDTRIISWLDTLPSTRRKRRDPLIPPKTKSDARAMDTRPSKRRRLLARGATAASAPPDRGGGGKDAEYTPRPAVRGRGRGAVLAASESSRTPTSSRPTGSGSSPRKRRAGMEVQPEEAIEVRLSGSPGTPQELLALTAEISRVAKGRVPVLHRSLQRELADIEAAARCQGTSLEGYDFDDSEFGQESAPAVPLIEDAPGAEVAKVFEAARRCEDREQNEAGWNQAVHFPLLRLALPSGGVIDFEPCTTAGITPEILPLSASSGGKVDYCLVVNKPVDLGQPTLEVIGNAPARETPREMIRLLRRTLPGLSINHTDFNALKKFPVAVSIETRKPGQSDEQAKVQVGVWQAAQWKMLHWQQDEMLWQMGLAAASAQAESTSVDHQAGDEASANAAEQDAEGRAAMPAPHSCIPPLVFLPAIVVVGHQWRIAATTCEERGGPTLLWMGSQIGTTDSMLGIYRIIWCVRRLARYASERYWPWYAENILGLRYEAPKDS